MDKKKINFNDKLNLFSDYWSPRVVDEMNDYQFKLVKLKGQFVWHCHDDTDETFIVIEGSMVIKFSDGDVVLNQGEMFVVPKGIAHMPYADEECKVLLIEPRGVVNTGDVRNTLTAIEDNWI